MASPAQRQEAARFVEGLEARGQSTWVYRSILDVARDRSVGSGSDTASPAVFYVFTDGVDNDPEGASMREMLEEFGELKRENDYLVYVTLGVDLPASDSTAFDEHEWGHLRKQPSGVLRLGVVHVRAKHLDFGFVEGELSDPRSMALRLSGVDPDSVRLNIVPSFPEIEAAGGVVEAEPIVIDFEAAGRLRLRIINSESVPEGVFEGELQVSAEQSHLQVLPSRLTAALTTVPLPTATVLGGDEGLDFGEWRIGDEGPPEARLQVELSAGARSEQTGFYVEVTPDSITPVVPSVAWNGQLVGEGDFLTSTERLNELVFSWPEAPTEDGALAGEVRLGPEALELQGAGPAPDAEGRVVVPWRLHVLPAPMPWWQQVLYGLLALAVLIVVLLGVVGLISGQAPHKAMRMFFVRAGIASPRLHGQLIYQPPGEEKQELPLSGSQPIRIGVGGDYLPELPDQVEFAPRYRDKKERVVATCREGNAQYRADGAYSVEPLDGQPLDRYDVLVMSDKKEVTFWSD